MTDRELLERAAKAAELDGYTWDEEFSTMQSPPQESNYGPAYTFWNPLTDDGDAFRLAVKLGLIVDTRMIPKPRFDTDEVCTIAVLPRPSERSVGEWHADSDPYAATRRAIVRAAASIGPTPCQ